MVNVSQSKHFKYGAAEDDGPLRRLSAWGHIASWGQPAEGIGPEGGYFQTILIL